MTMAITQAEYIWLDGAAPVQRLRSKSRIVALPEKEPVIETFPEWSFDGSSTYQASGNDSDLLLRPVSCLKDPLRGEGNYLVLCEVFNADGTPHADQYQSSPAPHSGGRGGARRPLDRLRAGVHLAQRREAARFPRRLGIPRRKALTTAASAGMSSSGGPS